MLTRRSLFARLLGSAMTAVAAKVVPAALVKAAEPELLIYDYETGKVGPYEPGEGFLVWKTDPESCFTHYSAESVDMMRAKLNEALDRMMSMTDGNA